MTEGKGRGERLNTEQALALLESRRRDPAFWLEFPELLVSDRYLEEFAAALKATLPGNPEWLRVTRPDGRFVLRFEDADSGMFLRVEPDYMVAILTNDRRIISPSYWERFLIINEKEMLNVEAAAEVKGSNRSYFRLGQAVRKEAGMSKEEKMMKLRENHVELELRATRAVEIHSILPGLRKLLTAAGYEVRDNHWEHFKLSERKRRRRSTSPEVNAI